MISFLMQVVGLQNWVSKLQIHVESQTSTFLHHRRETVTTLLTERGLVSKLSARGRMVGVRHKLMPHPISKYFSVSFFFFSELFKLNNIWSSWNKENHSHEGGLDGFWRFSISVYPIVFFFFWLRRYIKHSRQYFIGYPITSTFVKNISRRGIF